MTAGWVLPRDWDAGRLLRFLTGLAMLALAFAANAGLIATPVGAAPVAPATVTVDVPVADVATLDVSTADVAPAPAAPAPAMITVAVIEIGNPAIEPVLTADPAGVVAGTHGSRAPPAL
jgi:hypothetical protein